MTVARACDRDLQSESNVEGALREACTRGVLTLLAGGAAHVSHEDVAAAALEVERDPELQGRTYETTMRRSW